ncbi:MAG TPA: hypothetical protein VHP61_03785 [Acidobacteriota bacterium]|nr:hypothetical protein [Acidobacteriota bacterium]
MIATATLRTIVLVLFGLCIIWVLKVVVKREFETLVRALLVTALIGGAFLYLQQTQHPSISWTIIKSDIFPFKERLFTFTKEESNPGRGPRRVRYIFPGPGLEGAEPGPSPRLKLTLDPNGRHYNITDVVPVNRVLADLGLPPVKSGIRELAAVTGRLSDVNRYRWDDYELGILTIERGLCVNKDGLERYHCLVILTIEYP